jgi:hypothetical protein
VIEQIAQMTLKIKQYDRQILELTQTEYPETQALLKVQGVGHITALTFVLTLGTSSASIACALMRPSAHAPIGVQVVTSSWNEHIAPAVPVCPERNYLTWTRIF